MNRIKLMGGAYLFLSVTGILGYTVLLWKFPEIVLKISVFLFIAAVFGLLGWVGFIMLITPNFSKKSE